MVRGIAMLVSAFAAAAAQAQDTQMSRSEEKAAQVLPAPPVKSDPPGIVLASTTPPRSAPSASPPADVQGGLTSMAGCSVVEALLGDAPLATRAYKPPERAPKIRPGEAWVEPPAVRRAIHCGDRYVIQVRSNSAAPWVLKGARLEGPDGTVLKVLGVQSRTSNGQNVNVIVAEAPVGNGADFPLLRLHLAGEDGRVAVLDKVVLP